MSTALPTRYRVAAPISPAPAPREPMPTPAKVNLFGVQVTKGDGDEVFEAIMSWARNRRPASVAFFGVHGLTEASRDAAFMQTLNDFDVVTCDGQPVRWALNHWHKAGIAERVYGPTMMLRLCEAATAEGLGVYLYGSRPEVLDALTARLTERFPGLRIGGESPPFRPLTDDERQAAADRINDSGAALVFIGLGCPKQEKFAIEMGARIEAVQLCVGAAFDFHAGTVPMAPPWMQDAGLEWFYRLCQEPRRLWRRYLFSNARFLRLCLQRSIQGNWSRTGATAGSSSSGQRVPGSHCWASQQWHPQPGSPPALAPVSVVTPMYNERECVDMLIASLDRFEQALSDQFELEFILVDDGSIDDTAALLQSVVGGRGNYRIVRHERNRGIAAAIQTGIRAAVHEIVVSMDCDGSYDPLLIAELVPKLTPGVDLVTASPYHADGSVENVPLWRLRLSRLASRLYGAACRHKLSCYTSCFRVYRRSAVAAIELENERFVGVAELLWKIHQRGGQVVEHPAKLRSRVAGQSKMRVVRATLGHLRLIAKITATRLLRKPIPTPNPVTPRYSEASAPLKQKT